MEERETGVAFNDDEQALGVPSFMPYQHHGLILERIQELQAAEAEVVRQGVEEVIFKFGYPREYAETHSWTQKSLDLMALRNNLTELLRRRGILPTEE